MKRRTKRTGKGELWWLVAVRKHKTGMVRTLWEGCKEGLHQFGKNITGLVNGILLSVAYIVGIGLTTVAAKAAGKRFLDLAKRPGKTTYWRDVPERSADMEEHYRQF